MLAFFVLEEFKDQANQWLDQHPLILGLLAIALGGILLGFGIRDLKRGRTTDKHGNEYSGGDATYMSLFRVLFGVTICFFGLYKMIVG